MPEKTIADFLKRYDLWGRNVRCLVAVSGGIDSVTLLHALVQLRDMAGLELYAVHLNHGIRMEAEAETGFVRQMCERLQVPCTVGRTRIADWSAGKSLEMAARDVRRKFLMDTRCACGADVIFTAHHGDDQLETMLLRLTRGTSLTGLRGILPVKDGIARPLLTVSRSKIKDYAATHGLSWVEDISNQDETFERNRIRHRIAPVLKEMNPRLIDAVVRLSDQLRRDEEFIDIQLKPHLEQILDIPGGVRWKIENLHPALFSRMMTAMMDRSGMTQIRGMDIDMLTALARGEDRLMTLPQGYMARKKDGELSIFLEKDRVPSADAMLNIPGETQSAHGYFSAEYTDAHGEDSLFVQHFDAERMPLSIEVRTRRMGDEVFPLGCSGHMTLKKAMSMRKIPIQARESWPILAVDNRVLWVPGGRLMDQDTACSKQTCRYLKIEYHGEEISYYGTYSRE